MRQVLLLEGKVVSEWFGRNIIWSTMLQYQPVKRFVWYFNTFFPLTISKTKFPGEVEGVGRPPTST